MESSPTAIWGRTLIMGHQQASRTIQRTLASDTDQAHVLIDELIASLESEGWDGRDLFHVQMAVEEAIVNAIEHGNKRSLDKTVDVVAEFSAERFWMRVSDQGQGFDCTKLPDPTDEDHLECPRGRGVMLMRELMTEVHYNACGNSVEMSKLRSPAADAVSDAKGD